MTRDTRIRRKNTTRDDKKQKHARLCESNPTLITKTGRWEMPRERITELKGDAITLVYYEHADYLLATLWRGTSHVIIPRYPLLHVPPSNKAASSPHRGLVPTLKPQESSQDLREGDPRSNPTKGHKLTTKVNLSEQPRLAHTKM